MSLIGATHLPFQAGPPITDPMRFIGRRQLLRRVSQLMRSRDSISLRGERRIGKTSLLYFLASDQFSQQYELPENHITVYVDFQVLTAAPLAEVWAYLIDAVTVQLHRRLPHGAAEAETFRAIAEPYLGRSDGESLPVIGFRRATEQLGAKGVVLHLLFDEFDLTIQNPALSGAFYDTLRSLPQGNRNITYVIATRKGISDLQSGDRSVSSPFFNILNSQFIEPFTRSEAESMIDTYLTSVGIEDDHIQWFWEQVPLLQRLTGLYPFYFQLICAEIYEQITSTGRVGDEVLAAAVSIYERKAAEFFAHIYELATPAEHQLFDALARDSGVDHDLAAATSLRNRGLINKDDTLFADSFAAWIRDYAQDDALDVSQPTQLFERSYSLRQELRRQPFDEALSTYLSVYRTVVGSAQFERQLAERALIEGHPGAAPAFPRSILRRHSGIVLRWSLCQARHVPELPHISLTEPPALAEQDAILLARAWFHWPANPDLTSQRRRALGSWLTRYLGAQIWVVLALAKSNEPDLAVQYADRWLATAASSDLQPVIVLELLIRPGLRTVGVRSLERAIVLAAGNPATLGQLCAIASEQGCTQELLFATAIYLQRYESQSEAHLIAARRIAALATVEPSAALTNYRRYWFEPRRKASFPYPHSLLPILDRPADAEMRLFLLNHVYSDPSIPHWVELERRDIRGIDTTIAAWIELVTALQSQLSPTAIFASPCALHIMAHATAAALHAGSQRAGDAWAQLSALWQSGVNADVVATLSLNPALLARSAVVLLDPLPARQIHLYQAVGANPPTHDHWLIAQAMDAYIVALCRLKLWSALCKFTETNEQLLSGPVFQPRMMQFFRALRTLEADRTAKRINDHWYTNWEILLSRPQLPFQVEAMLDYYLFTMQWIKQEEIEPPNPARLKELRFEIERRAKALGELRLSRGTLIGSARRQFASQLNDAKLDQLPSLLTELHTIVRSV